MLSELSEYENLGTPKYFFELLTQLSNGQRWTKRNVNEYFFNKIIDGRNVFDGCIPLAVAIGVITINNDEVITINPEFRNYLSNDKYIYAKLLEKILTTIEEDELFNEIFTSINISYDIIYHSIQISNSAFPFKHINIKRLLIDFGFFNKHPDESINRLIVNPKYKKIFDKKILLGIRKRKTGIEEFQKILEQKQLYGEQAEIFAMQYEHSRLAGHSKIKNIERISEYDVGAGYDIASFDDLGSLVLDRFIEVKSFTNNPNFYWSRNEIDIAKIKRERYFLYLVDRSKISEEKYAPTIIQDPYSQIVKNESEWDLRAEKYFIQKR